MIVFVPNEVESSVKVLGILLDNKLTLKDHINHVKSKISSAIFSLNQMKHILDQKHLKLLASAYIKSHIDYCSNLFTLCNIGTIKPLNILLKKTVRVIKRKKKFAHTAPLFRELEILPVPEQIEFNVLKFMHKRYNNKLPPTLNCFWERNRDRNDREMRNEHDFFIEHARLISYKSHPYFKFPHLWNSLSNDMKAVHSNSIFCEILKDNLLNRVLTEHLQNNNNVNLNNA